MHPDGPGKRGQGEGGSPLHMTFFSHGRYPIATRVDTFARNIPDSGARKMTDVGIKKMNFRIKRFEDSFNRSEQRQMLRMNGILEPASHLR